MGKDVYFNLNRSGVVVAMLMVAGLPLLPTASAQASPTVEQSFEIGALASLTDLKGDRRGAPSNSQVAAVTPLIPNLPPLGNADSFLPVPAEDTIRLVIRLGDRRVYIYQKDQVVQSYPIAIGRSGWETPTGKFEVIQMFREPVWEHPFTGELVPPGPEENPLGSRWIGFWTDGTNYIGFHGTPNAETVGQAASHGCIRMYNQDVVALFEIVQMGTPVEVVP